MPMYQDWNNSLWLQQLQFSLNYFFKKFDVGGNLKLHRRRKKTKKKKNSWFVHIEQ